MSDPLRPNPTEALAEWARRVRENREQVERVREDPERADHYAPIATVFRADPRREDEPALAVLRSLVRPGERWLDIGAGGGRYALPLALAAGEVIAVEPSEGMLDVLRASMAEYGIANVTIRQSRWPMVEPVQTDVALIAHVGYDVEEIGPFLDAMEASARRLCIAVLFWRRPTWAADELWPTVHGQDRATLPALPELLALQLARGRPFELRLVEQLPMTYESVEQALTFARMQTWVRPDGDKDRALQALVAERVTEREGRYAFSWDPIPLGVLTWAPPSPTRPAAAEAGSASA